MTFVAMTIAGSDPSGGAGIQADLKTFHQRKVFGTSVVTLVTVQNTQRLETVEVLSPDLVVAQLDAILSDIPPSAAKTGALGNGEIIRAIGSKASSFDFPLVVDPVMISKHGTALLQPDAVEDLVRFLLPKAFLVTPNLHEASALADIRVENRSTMEKAARRITRLGTKAVLVKGGHLKDDALDLLYYREQVHEFRAERIHTPHTHGTGCTYSATIAAELAKGKPLPDAVSLAKRFITQAIREHPTIGKGVGPVSHQITIDEEETGH